MSEGKTKYDKTVILERSKTDMLNKISLILVIIGALNWLTIGLFGFDCVGAIFGGQMAILSRIIYTLVGLAGLWCITFLFSHDKVHETR